MDQEPGKPEVKAAPPLQRNETEKKEAIPRSMEDVGIKLTDAFGRIDYDAVTQGIKDRYNWPMYPQYIIGQVLELSRIRYQYFHEPDQFDSDQKINASLSKIDDCSQGLLDYLTDKPRPDFVLQDGIYVGLTGEEVIGRDLRIWTNELLEEATNQAEKYYQLKTYYTDNAHWPYDPEYIAISELWKALDFENNPNNSEYLRNYKPHYDLDYEFLQYLNAYSTDMIHQLSQKGVVPLYDETTRIRQEAIDKVDSKKQVEEITFSGFEPPPEMKVAVSVSEIKRFLANYFPPGILGDIKEVIYIDERKKLNDGTYTAGDFGPIRNNTGDLDFSSYIIRLRRHLFFPLDTDDKLLEQHKSNFLNTLAHEVGHNVERMMTYDDMVNWDQLVTQDHTPVSNYIERLRQRNDRDIRAEDFADSFALAVQNPGILRIISPERYFYMAQFIIRRHHSDQKGAYLIYYFQTVEDCLEDVKDKTGLINTNYRQGVMVQRGITGSY